MNRDAARRTCVVLAATAASWALLALITGGVSLDAGVLHLSSRNPRNPALIAALATVAAFALATGGRTRAIAGDLRWMAGGIARLLQRPWHGWTRVTARLDGSLPPAVAPALVLVIAAAVGATSIRESAFVAAGSDAWGYVSQAHMWATWTLRMPEPLLSELSGFLPREAVAPMAYRPSPEGATIVPVTSPGLPMLMAVFELAGGPQAVFAVVPLLAVMTVWATYLLGRDVTGRWTGVVSAALLASSPAFLFQLTSAPMSDIPATAWWTLSLVFALRGGRSSALGSGVAAGVAILIRANLAPVALVPAALVFTRQPNAGPRRDVFWFAAGVVPAAFAIGVLYDYWYGSPLNSGYGALGQLYSTANLLPNLSHYARWLPDSQTPLIVVGLAAPFLVTRHGPAAGLLVFAGAVVACYVFYIPFDAWWYLRFLLPAYPAMLVLTATSLIAVTRWLPREFQAAAVAATVVLVGRHTIEYASDRATFDSGGEQKYAITGTYVADHLPTRAIIVSELYSGAIRYYAGRPTIRFGAIPSDHMEGAVSELRRRGYAPYLVIEDWEEDVFRRQFAGRPVLSALAGGPQVELPLGHVRIYPLAR